MRFATSVLMVLALAAPAAGQIDFPDRIRSTRMDGTLISADAVYDWQDLTGFSDGLCLKADGADDVAFGACGGLNSITAITTDASSGLRSSVSSGTATLRIDPSRSTLLSVNVVAGTDQILMDDASQSTRRLYVMTVASFAQHLAGGGNSITANSNGEITVSSIIARDSELPSGVDLTLSGQDLGVEVTMPGRTNLTDTIALPAVRTDADIDGRIATWARANNPTGIMAGQCLRGNSAGDAIEFAACGTGGTNDYDALLNRPIFRVGLVSSIPTPGVTNVGRRYQTNDGHQYLIVRRTVAGVDRVIEFETYPLVSGAGYQGAVNDHTALPNTQTAADEGKWWLVRDYLGQGIAPFVVVDSNGGLQSVAHIPDAGHDYDGQFRSEADAEADGTLDAQSAVIYPNQVDNPTLYRVVASTFVAGSPEHDGYFIDPTDLPDTLLARVAALEAGGGGSPLTVIQGSTTVTSVDQITFTGATVTDNSDGDVTVAISGGGGSFDLYDDVTISQSLLGGTDRFLFADDSVAGDPNTYITFSNLSDQVRPDWRNEGSTVSQSPQFINCVGAGIDCTLNGSEVRIGVTATGDITSVTTTATSGLSGGANSGDVALAVDPSRLTNFGTGTLHRSDTLVIRDDSDTATKRIALEVLLARIAGTNLGLSADGTQLNATSGGGTFVSLTDTPAAITANECVQGNAAGDAIIFGACASTTGLTTSIMQRRMGMPAELSPVTTSGSASAMHGLGRPLTASIRSSNASAPRAARVVGRWATAWTLRKRPE